MEATRNDGRLARLPLKNRTREVEAHQFLLLRFNQMIESYDVALEVISYLFSCGTFWGSLTQPILIHSYSFDQNLFSTCFVCLINNKFPLLVLQSLTRSKHPLSGKHTRRMQLAQDLLTGELRILESASSWLKNYCETLKDLWCGSFFSQ